MGTDFSACQGCGTALVTGATGFIGRAVVRALLDSGFVSKAIAVTRSPGKAAAYFGGRPELSVVGWDEGWEARLQGAVDFVVHCAAITDSRQFIQRPAETIDSIVLGTRRVLEFLRSSPKAKMLYLSTPEVYGIGDYACQPVDEAGYGYLDILDVRSSYPQAKALAETMCQAYVQEYGCHISIARLGQVLSAEVEQTDRRMFAQFVRAASRGEDIVLHTAGETVRSYCSLPDCVSALLCILEAGEDGEAYNVANEAMTFSVREIAEMVAAQFRICVRYEQKKREETGYLPQLHMQLSAAKLRGLGWEPHVDLGQILAQIKAERGSVR